jgi:hypothetical protein
MVPRRTTQNAGRILAAPTTLVFASIWFPVNRRAQKDMHISAYRLIVRRNALILFRGGGVALFRQAGQRLHQIKQALAEFRVGNGKEGAVELNAFGA